MIALSKRFMRFPPERVWWAVLIGIWVAGLIWGMLSAAEREQMEIRLRQSLRELDLLNTAKLPTLGELESLERRFALAFPASVPESRQAISGIELSASLQTFVHASRDRLASQGIELLQPDLGFEHAIHEGTLVTSEVELRILSEQLGLTQAAMELLIAAAPLAIGELHNDVMHDPESGVTRIQLRFDMHGYTRCLRSWVQQNLALDSGQRLRVVSLVVDRSPLCEPDQSSEVFAEMTGIAEPMHGIPQSEGSGFASYLQQEGSTDSERTEPLIGKIVSRFRITVERKVMP